MKKNLSLIAAAGCLLALFEMPDEFYKILRFAVVAACAYIIFEIQKSTATDKSKSWTSIGFGLLAVVFNPILPLEMHESDWVWFNIAGALMFAWVVFENKLKEIPDCCFSKSSDIKNPKQKLPLKLKIILFLTLICIICPLIIFFHKELRLTEQALGIVAGVFVVSGLLFSILGIIPENNNDAKKSDFNEKTKKLLECSSLEERNELMKKWGYKGK